MNRRIYVRTPSRLHFGLTSLGHDSTQPQFGGVGVMIDSPGLELEVAPGERFTASGPLSERVARFAASMADHWKLPGPPDLHINVLAAPREHVGLGVGTQLGSAVAAGMAEALGFPWRDPIRLAQLTRRGRRSAVGTYGFLLGGLVVDAGHRRDEPLGELAFRADFLSGWRFLLMMPREQSGIAGVEEDRAFAKLPPVPRRVTLEFEQLINTQLIPAVKEGDFRTFSGALYEYGCLAGKCFASTQGGTFASPQTAELIAWLREQGITGVGQSSWGPTVFALIESQESAEELSRSLGRQSLLQNFDTTIARPANSGVIVEVRE